MSNTGTLLSPVRPPAPYPSTPRAERGRAVIRLWLPLTPLWLILAPFALLVSPALTLAPATRRMSPFRAAWAVGRRLLALSGTLIEVDSPAAVVRIHVL